MLYPNIYVMRRDISKVYDGPRWKNKVKNMPDEQVFAIWNKFCDEGKFDNLKRKTIHTVEENQEKRVDQVVSTEEHYYEQLAFDL